MLVAEEEMLVAEEEMLVAEEEMLVAEEEMLVAEEEDDATTTTSPETYSIRHFALLSFIKYKTSFLFYLLYKHISYKLIFEYMR
jgi:hypothetical protein